MIRTEFYGRFRLVQYKLSQSILRVENAVTAAVAQVELMLQRK